MKSDFLSSFRKIFKEDVHINIKTTLKFNEDYRKAVFPDEENLLVTSFDGIKNNSVYLSVYSDTYRPFLNFEEFSKISGYKIGDILIYTIKTDELKHERHFQIYKSDDKCLYNQFGDYMSFKTAFVDYLYKRNNSFITFGKEIRG